MNNPQTRMAAFDAMSMTDRELANEYGVNVVRLYRGLGADNDAIRVACERHRLNKQRETLVPIKFTKQAQQITRKMLQADLAHILTKNAAGHLPIPMLPDVIAETRVMADAIIEETNKSDPPQKKRPDPWYIRWMRPNGS